MADLDPFTATDDQVAELARQLWAAPPDRPAGSAGQADPEQSWRWFAGDPSE